MNIDELCDEVNRVLAERGVKVADGRTSSVVTPRNIRYYCSLGLVRYPVREGRRAKYEMSHVDEVVSVKMAQEDGASLEQILKARRALDKPEGRTDTLPWRLDPEATMNLASSLSKLNFSAVTPMRSEVVDTHLFSRLSRSLGWSVRIGEVTLSGSGEPPTASQIDAIESILKDADDE